MNGITYRGMSKTTLPIFCILILTMAALAIAPTFAAKATDKVTGGGWFISEKAPWSGFPNVGDECHFGVVAMMKDDEWTGQGSFMDKDYKDGLKAILTVEDGKPHKTGYIIYGTAKLYINHKYHCDAPFEMGLVDDNPDRVSMKFFGHEYYGCWTSTLAGGEVVVH